MRLLNAKTEQLKQFFDDKIPWYAILSHTWQNDEVEFKDINPGHCAWHVPRTQKERDAQLYDFISRYRAKQGYGKILGCCRQALADGFEWVWVDTCCIDSSSSSELQEAINSMYSWYEKSEVCYAYLEDVPLGEDAHGSDSAFLRSRWFMRGWTLQELLAPNSLQFFNRDWGFIGNRNELASEIEMSTGISTEFMGQEGSSCRAMVSVAKKMSWAGKRSTRRKEDVAYCLLGLFGVNMPMLYGEGSRAFIRLQEEIHKKSRDQSILASGYRLAMPSEEEIHHHHRWPTPPSDDPAWSTVPSLARYPADFVLAGDVLCVDTYQYMDTFAMGEMGLELSLPWFSRHGRNYCILNCGISTGRRIPRMFRLIAIPLEQLNTQDTNEAIPNPPPDYARLVMQIPIFVSKDMLSKAESKTFFLHETNIYPPFAYGMSTVLALGKITLPDGFFLTGIFPPQEIPFNYLLFDTNNTRPRAMLHIAGCDWKRGILLSIYAEGHSLRYGRYCDSRQNPCVTATPVPNNFSIIDMAEEYEQTENIIMLDHQPKEVMALDLGGFPIREKGAVIVEVVSRKGKPFINIVLLNNMADSETRDAEDTSRRLIRL
ncbi:heterokaryon incompatibility protein-domain-containing protein [Xylariaceae sp. FL0016]|nr:heterokaryon incompatibility protein-domain-containing protein [Xylariaceae sp. FL0016]